ncbi:hypothetical protein [Bacillus sp. Marseille-P3800]|uniref:hypothetical protein n=1 Tax=Bacillus sp. Marseille-P3800 TaxID=2014782 RepID=UPI000C080B97|nr:hypothetical protein [Bacillus sp. Marseille-P3800]
MGKKKRISMKKAEADVKRIEAKEEYELKDGNTLWFNPEFSTDKIDLLINEYQNDAQEMIDAQINFDDTYAMKYLCFLMVKHFTEYGEHISPEVLVKVQQCNNLAVNGHISEILNEVFVDKQIHKVMDQFAAKTAAMQYITRIDEKISTEFDRLELRNQDAIDGVFKKAKKHTQKVKQQKRRDENKKKVTSIEKGSAKDANPTEEA